MTTPSTMPQVRVHAPNDVRLDTVSCPKAGPKDVLVQVASCGICGSDPFYIAVGSFAPDQQPMPIGHELSGTIVELGSEVSHLSVGQRVVIDPYPNSIGNGGLEGGFGSLLLVRDVLNVPEQVFVLPDELSFEEGALVEPLAVAMHAVNQSGIQAGQKAVVFGAGPVGVGVLLALRHRGIKSVVVIDNSKYRLQLAEELGAEICVGEENDTASYLTKVHGEAAELVRGQVMPDTDVYFEATGAGPVLEQSIAIAKTGACIVILGVHKSSIALDPQLLLTKELTLIGSKAYPNEFPQVIDMLRSANLDAKRLISHRLPLADFHTALDIAIDPLRSAKVLLSIPTANAT